jgi:hypothetical protein
MADLRQRGFEVGRLVPTLQIGTRPPGSSGRPAVWAAAPAQGAAA